MVQIRMKIQFVLNQNSSVNCIILYWPRVALPSPANLTSAMTSLALTSSCPRMTAAVTNSTSSSSSRTKELVTVDCTMSCKLPAVLSLTLHCVSLIRSRRDRGHAANLSLEVMSICAYGVAVARSDSIRPAAASGGIFPSSTLSFANDRLENVLPKKEKRRKATKINER